MSFGFGMVGFELMFQLVFFVVLGVIVVQAIRGIGQWGKNNASPRLTVEATVVAKRTNVTHHHHTDMPSSTATQYYATFQVESGDRMELSLSGREYGMMVEGDKGKLTFQGTRFLSFERT